MTPGVFKNRYIDRVKFFKKYKKEPFVSFETLEETYEIDETLQNETVKNFIDKALLTLTPREERIIRLRFFENRTLEYIGERFAVTRDRIRQIEAKALRKLKHPSRELNKVRGY